MKYASRTTVSVDKSKAEIEKLLRKYGAEKFASGWDVAGATIGFQLSNRFIRFVLPLKNASSIDKSEKLARQSWRALTLVIKAKLEAVASGITHFEDEFMAHIVMPGGKTVSEMVRPEICKAYESGKPLQLMAGY